MAVREDKSKYAPFTDIDNTAFVTEYDSSSANWTTAIAPKNQLDLSKPNTIIPSVSAITESAYLRLNPPNALHSNGIPDLVSFTIRSEPYKKLEHYDHPPIILASVGSPVESDAMEPGCATRLLEHERLSTRNLQQRTYVSHIKSPRYPFKLQKITVQNSSTNARFLKWNWPAIRLGCLVTLVSSLVAMICVVVGVIIVGPFRCNPQREWWQGAVMYEVFPASYLDSDNDGFGDFKGLIQRLDYIQSLNISVLRLSSIFSALDYPLEYEHIIDFINVDPHLGRMEDLDVLINELHARGMYLVLDINPTLTSDQHTWAAHWLLDSRGEYQYYYINTTESLEELLESADDEDEDQEWTVPHRTFGGWYYLNWSHPQVRLEMIRVLEFWIHRGVDGFYFKHIEDMHVERDEDIVQSIQQWREIINMPSHHKKLRMMMVSTESLQNLGGTDSSLVNDILSLFDLLDVHLDLDGNASHHLMKQVDETTKWNARWIHWNIGNVETARLSSILDSRYTLASLVLLMMLPGSVSLFYGDEVGLQDSVDKTTGKIYREGQLCPMQWTINSLADNNNTLGQTPPWLPAGYQNPKSNVESQRERIRLISELITLRNQTVPIAMNSAPSGTLYTRGSRTNTKIHLNEDGVLVLERYYPRRPRYVVAANFGPMRIARDISETLYEMLILIGTNPDKKDRRLQLKDFVIDPGEAFVGEMNR